MLSFVRIRPAIVLAAVALALPGAAGMQMGRQEPVAQNRALLSALVALGGGPCRFSGTAFRRALERAKPGEERRLRGYAGGAAVTRFDTVFTVVVDDAVARLRRERKALPLPPSLDPKIVAALLYRAGLRDGTFDVERVFDTLFSPDIHEHAMIAVGAKYGPSGEAAYHTVFARLVEDVGAS